MLTEVFLQNLVGYDDSVTYRVPLNKITALMGPNNAGKSTIITAINMAKLSMLGQGFSYGTSSYLLNSFPDAVYLHNTQRTITVGVQLSDSFLDQVRLEISQSGMTIKGTKSGAPAAPNNAQ